MLLARGALALLLMMACDASKAGSDPAAEADPPAEYRLADVVMTARHQPGNPAADPTEVAVHGAGHCERRVGDTRVECPPLAPDAVLALLNEFYALDFPTLEASYRTRRSVVVLEDGTVRSQARRMADAGSTRLCLKLGSYEKCVSFLREPVGLSALASRILALGAGTAPSE